MTRTLGANAIATATTTVGGEPTELVTKVFPLWMLVVAFFVEGWCVRGVRDE